MFLIRSLEHGGAERQLVALARGLHQRGRSVVVVTFYGDGPLEPELKRVGVPVRVLGKDGRWDLVRFVNRLVSVVREERPSVLHGYLSVSNLLAVVLRRFIPGLKVVWSVRDSGMDVRRYDWGTGVTRRLENRLARFTDLIVSNSWSGRDERIASGFPAERVVVVPNGIDVDRFRPNRELGRALRQEWGVGHDERLVGVVARLDPMKDHNTFLEAAALVARSRPDVRFVCVGAGPADYERELREKARHLGLEGRLIWAGGRDDMLAVYNSLDLLCSSSLYGEGFSNVIGEAMACGLRCVVTDVGDSARVVGDTGVVVRGADAAGLAAAMQRSLELPREPVHSRERIVENFSVERLVDATEELLWPAG